MHGENNKFQPGPTWKKTFVLLGILSVVGAFVQSALQIFALRISVTFFVEPYIWFFILNTWATVIYMCYTVRLLYLVSVRRQSDLSRYWWYFAVVVIVVNPAQSVWWWIHEDYILTYVSLPSSVINFVFFVLVCRTMASGRIKRKKKNKTNQEEGREGEEEEGGEAEDELEDLEKAQRPREEFELG